MVRGEFQREIGGDGSTVHHPNYVGASDIQREDNELMRYIVHRLDEMYYLLINDISFYLLFLTFLSNGSRQLIWS